LLWRPRSRSKIHTHISFAHPLRRILGHTYKKIIPRIACEKTCDVQRDYGKKTVPWEAKSGE
jgi:hypothetical protein